MTGHRDVGERAFRLLLRIYPPTFRRRFGEEMVEFFRERRIEQYRRRRGPSRLWAHLLADMAVNAPLLHARALLARATALRPATSRDVPWSDPEYPAESRSMEILWQDVRYALRALARRPAFAAVAILTLALGIGATTAVYSVADAVLLQPLPWPGADRMVSINTEREGSPQQGIVFLDYLDWRQANHSFDRLGVFRPQSVNLTGSDRPERVIGMFADAGGLRLFGASVALGRMLTDQETEVETKQPVALLADGFWRTRFGAKGDAIGRTVVLNGQPFVVVGVLRPGVQTSMGAPDVWMPIGYYPNKGDLTTRGRMGVAVLGRLKPGVSLGQAQSDLTAIATRLGETYPATNAGLGVRLADLKETVVGSSRSQVYLVLAAVMMVLLIACANVANLQLARAASRRQELSVRCALGAARSRLIRQLVTESLLVSVAGGVAGVAIAYGGVKWLSSVIPNVLQFFGVMAINPGVLLFAGAVTIGTGLLFALPPAWRASRVRLNDALTVRGANGGRGAFGRGSPLVVAQMALCVVLLVTGGLLTRRLIALTRVNPGFDSEHVLTMQFRLPPAKYDSDDKIAGMFSRTLDELRALPGVTSAALVRAAPLNGNGETVPYQLDGRGDTDPKRLPTLQLNIVSPGYYRTMRIARVAGRDFTANDRAGTEPVVIVNRQLADKVAPAGSALGARIDLPDGAGLKWFTVVGVVADAKQFDAAERQLDQAYVPFAQRPMIFTEVVLRTAGDPSAVAANAREAIWRVDRDQPVWRVRPLALSIGNALGGRAFVLRLLAGFALLAVVLATIGIYGVTSYAVAGRTKEMGIRVALGARAPQVVRLVVRQSMTMVGVAITIGLVASVGATRLIETQLFGTRTTDPVVYAIVPFALAAVALMACYVPARRASRVDPVATLRAD